MTSDIEKIEQVYAQEASQEQVSPGKDEGREQIALELDAEPEQSQGIQNLPYSPLLAAETPTAT